MERSDVILLAGTIAGLIWMGACVIIEGKNRKYVIMAGAMIDIVVHRCVGGTFLRPVWFLL